jgi:hypothetical protein
MNFIFKILSLAFFSFLLFSTTACEKEEGEGGTSSITGRVYAIDYNSEWTVKKGEYYAPGIDVFIIYGNDSIYSDQFETGIGGWYRFNYLREGNYTVYAFSRDSTQQEPSGEIPVIKRVKITGKDQTVVVDDIVIFD